MFKNSFKRLEDFNVKVNEKKCKFFKDKVEFLDYVVDSKGIHPTNKKIKVIMETPTPKSLTELKSYLGLINYYGKFIPICYLQN